VYPPTEYAGFEPPYEKVALAEGEDWEKLRVAAGLRQEADFSKLIIFLLRKKKYKILRSNNTGDIHYFLSDRKNFFDSRYNFFQNIAFFVDI
jgi:hypothetical protein